MVLEIVQNESKNKEEALEKCLEELNVNSSEVFYIVSEEETGGLFSKKKYVVKALTKYSVKEYIKQYFNELAKKMNTTFNIEVNESDNVFSVLVVTDNNAVLIGKDGNTLNSIQMLLRQSVRKYGDFGFKINLDIAGYKSKKERNIMYEVKKVAREVLKTKVDAKLDPMNSYERRIVHTALSEFKNIATESEGEEPNRCVIIKYKED